MKLDNETKAKIDVAVTEAVRNGEYRALKISMAVRSALPHQEIDNRVIDKSLQRLRKQGIIAYASRSGWSAVALGDKVA